MVHPSFYLNSFVVTSMTHQHYRVYHGFRLTTTSEREARFWVNFEHFIKVSSYLLFRWEISISWLMTNIKPPDQVRLGLISETLCAI